MEKLQNLEKLVNLIGTPAKMRDFFHSTLDNFASVIDHITFAKIKEFIDSDILPLITKDIICIYDSILDEDLVNKLVAFYIEGDGKLFLEKNNQINEAIEKIEDKWLDLLNNKLEQILSNRNGTGN